MNWNEIFSGDSNAVVQAVKGVRTARRDLENVIRRISIEKDDLDMPVSAAARWTRQERLRDAYEKSCKLVAVAEVELLRAVLEAAKVSSQETSAGPERRRIVSVG